MRKIMAASAAAPGISHLRAVAALAKGVEDPVLGPIHMDEVQLCPQHAGRLSEAVVDTLMEEHPDTRFRIHATPRVEGTHVHRIVEAVDAFDHPEQMAATAALSKRMGAIGYTLHAGRRELGTLERVFENTRRLADLFGCRVGVEGLYPSIGRHNTWLLASWAEHEEMLKARIPYALDVSHINIVAKRERDRRPDLLRDLLSSPNMMEFHLSDNDARADSHRPLTAGSPPWWTPFLDHVHPDASVFYEGILIDPRRKALPSA